MSKIAFIMVEENQGPWKYGQTFQPSYIKKAWHFALRDVFIYKKTDTSKKARQFALRFFIYKKPDTLRYAIFHGIFEIVGGWRAFLWTKSNGLCVKYLYAKKMHFPLCFYKQKAETLRHICICKKQCILRYKLVLAYLRLG